MRFFAFNDVIQCGSHRGGRAARNVLARHINRDSFRYDTDHPLYIRVSGRFVVEKKKLTSSRIQFDEYRSPYPASPRTRPAVRSKQIVSYYLYNYTSSSYIYVYMCMYIYLYTHTHIDTYTHTHTHTHTHIYIYIYIYICIVYVYI